MNISIEKNKLFWESNEKDKKYIEETIQEANDFFSKIYKINQHKNAE